MQCAVHHMKYGILGDIHANLNALRSVLAALDAEGVDEVVSVGDVVGYGAAPRECLHLLLERKVRIVMGNHDAAAVGLLPIDNFNPAAAFAARWTATQLSPEERSYLARLPLRLEYEHILVAHATWDAPERFDYIMSSTDAEPSLALQPRRVCFIGHTHRPLLVGRLRDEINRTFWTHDTRVDLSEWQRVLVNVGSVGQPRDDDPRAAVAVYDTESELYSLLRVAYDIEREQQRILRAGLPPILAERLALGF